MISVQLSVNSTKGSAKLKLMTKIVTFNWTRVENACKIVSSKTFAFLIHFDSMHLEKKCKKNRCVYMVFIFKPEF